jgi:hypothetical protein
MIVIDPGSVPRILLKSPIVEQTNSWAIPLAMIPTAFAIIVIALAVGIIVWARVIDWRERRTERLAGPHGEAGGNA